MNRCTDTFEFRNQIRRVEGVVRATDAYRKSQSGCTAQDISLLLNSLSVQEMRLYLMLYGCDTDGWTRRSYKNVLQFGLLLPSLPFLLMPVISFLPAVMQRIGELLTCGLLDGIQVVCLVNCALVLVGLFRFLFFHSTFPRKRQQYISQVFGEDISTWPCNNNPSEFFALIQDSKYIGSFLEMYCSLFRYAPEPCLERLLWKIDAQNVPSLDATHIATLAQIFEQGGRRGMDEGTISLRKAVAHAALFLQNDTLNKVVQEKERVASRKCQNR